MLTFYGLPDTQAWTAAGGPVDAFQKLYPWATVNYLGLQSGDETNKMLAELKANAVQSDVSQNNNAPSLTNFAAGMYVPFCNPYEASAGYPASVLAGITTNSSATCVFHPAFGNYAAIAWNTNAFPSGINFTKWSDITNPQFKGVLAADKPTRLSTFGGILNLIGENMTGSQWVSFMNQFKANQPILTASAGTVFTDLSSGQATVGISTTDDLVKGVGPGVPVAYKWVNPIPVLTSYFAISKGAPHPNTAKLFIYFITSMAGQTAIGNTGRLPMLPAAASATVLKSIQVPVPSNYNLVPNPDQKLLNNQTAILNLYTSIFGS